MRADVKTLKDVDENLVQTGKSVMDLASDDKRMECLKTFSECQDVVTWIRQITKGLVSMN